MSFDANTPNDPLSFMRNLWGNMGFSLPGMVAPTFDVEELDKRIQDLKTVEGWLRMNLSMLQMTIQGLEMQRTTVSTVQTMGKMAREAAETAVHQAEDLGKGFSEAARPSETSTSANENTAAAASALSEAAMWPWQMMQQMREQMEQHVSKAAEAVAASGADKEDEKSPRRKTSRSKKTD